MSKTKVERKLALSAELGGVWDATWEEYDRACEVARKECERVKRVILENYLRKCREIDAEEEE